jgi:predicted lipoprotein with Yx(FWY)xxD motif
MRPTVKMLLPTLVVSLALAACGGSSNGSGSSSSTPAASTSGSAATTGAASTTGTTSSTGAASTTGTSTSGGAEAVKTASNAKLGATVLVDARGLTIYHLAGESASRFICTSAECEAHWPPVGAGAINSSIAGLGTVKRPDGKEQLTYKGEPLYTFAGDSAPGEANGQGFKDVGTWSAVTTGAASSSSGAGASGSGGSSASGSGEGGASGSGESGEGGSGYKY